MAGTEKGHNGSLTTSTGRSLGGAPLAFSKLPAEDLRPWFTWLAVTDASLPADRAVHCCMLNDHATIRVLFGGEWTAHTRDGPRLFLPGQGGLALYFGPQSKAMQLTVRGCFKAATLHLGPGASSVLGAPPQAEMLDRIADFDRLTKGGEPLSSYFDRDWPPARWLSVFERRLRRFMAVRQIAPPSRLAQAFEEAAMADPNLSVHAFAHAQGISPRTLERAIRREYGLTPKQALRRARALDLAAALIGVAMEEEEAELRLRFFDQSHQIREIRHFFDATPAQLRDEPHPLLTLNLEIRQSRRIEMLKRLSPGQIQPWRDPRAEPAA